MEVEKNNGEVSYHSTHPFKSAEGSSSPQSAPFLIIDREESINLHRGEVADDQLLFLTKIPDTASENKLGIELEDAKSVDSLMQHDILAHIGFDEPKEIDTPKSENGVAAQSFIDTAAPFASVRAAVSKFGGIVEVKTEEHQSMERHKHVQVELKKVQEEALKYQKRCEDEEYANAEILKELDSSKRIVDELKLEVEKAETQEDQAKQDSQLADLRLKEVEQGIDRNSSAATKAQLDLARERHAGAVAELTSVKKELESIQSQYASHVQQRDVAVNKATEIITSLEETEKTVKYLSLELITTKELAESAHVAHLRVEDRIIGATLTLEIEKLIWEKGLKHAEEEVQQFTEEIMLTNEVKSKLDKASILLLNLKAELASPKQAASDASSDDVEEVKLHIENANGRVSHMRIELSSVQSEIEIEKASLNALRQKEGLASITISSLEDELNKQNTELKLILKKAGSDEEEIEELPKTLQEASETAEQAEKAANLAREELRKAKEEASQAKAEANAMEMRLYSALSEIEAIKASQTLASSKVKASVGCDDSSGSIRVEVFEVFDREIRW
ncbi:hypothetical protein Cni_G17543 [Canna indica]|uniref:Uncharacterized protein n=1 Tax=Canna indica TaxID=4628 RepID=A0AAQ3QHU8_9LILI|nr:hypothetical protein Cni_G17543 [Canna indica]